MVQGRGPRKGRDSPRRRASGFREVKEWCGRQVWPA